MTGYLEGVAHSGSVHACNAVSSTTRKVKKLEHKGVKDRLVRGTRWIKVVAGDRKSSRNTHLVLQDVDLTRHATGFML